MMRARICTERSQQEGLLIALFSRETSQPRCRGIEREKNYAHTQTHMADENRSRHCKKKGRPHAVQRRSTEVPPNPSTAHTVRRIVSRRVYPLTLPCCPTGKRAGNVRGRQASSEPNREPHLGAD